MFVSIIVSVSFVEGYYVSWKFAFLFGLSLSVMSSHYAIKYTLGWDGDEHQFELWEGASFGMLGFIASCYRVLSLFLWKQTLMTVYTRGEWCICVYVSPYIKWQRFPSNLHFLIGVFGHFHF